MVDDISMASLLHHATIPPKQGSASRSWQIWCTACAWMSEHYRTEDGAAKAAAAHEAERNGTKAPKARLKRTSAT